MDEVLIGIRAVHFASSAILAGALLFRVFVAAPAFRVSGAGTTTRVGAPWLAWTALAVAVLSGVAWFIVVAMSMAGQSLREVFSTGTAWIALTETEFGRNALVRLIAAALVAVTLGAAASRHENPWSRWLPAVFAAGLLVALAATGHSGATPGLAGDVNLAADALHLLAAGAWVGGLLSLVLLLIAALRRDDDNDWSRIAAAAARRFSVMGIVSVTMLALTGLVNSWMLVGSFRGLVVTDYGRLLMAKLALFGAMLGLAAVNRWRLTPRLARIPDRAGALRALTRNSLVELALGLIVFAIVGALGTMHPAIHLVPR